MKSIRLLGATLLASTTLLGATGVFASEPNTPTPATAKTPITAELTLNEHPEKPEPPKEPGEGGGDQETDIDGLFGIAYAPGALSGTKQLADNGETTVELSNNSAIKYNVGVQDKTRAKDRDWTLSAKLEWDEASAEYMAGSTITATNGNVKLNDGKGNLSEVTNKEVRVGKDAVNLVIDQMSQAILLESEPGKIINGVYNYQFQNPQLIIPYSENVPADTYSGNIVWNLSDALGN